MSDHEYVHGTMDIEAQRGTFGVFWALTKWGSVFVGIALIVLVLTRTNAIDCKNSEQAAAHINACGKTASAVAAAQAAPAEAAPAEATPAPATPAPAPPK